MGNDSAVAPSSCSVSVLRVFPREIEMSNWYRERKRSRHTELDNYDTSQILPTSFFRRQIRLGEREMPYSFDYPWHSRSRSLSRTSFLLFSLVRRKICCLFGVTNRRRGLATRNSIRREIGTDTRCNPSSTSRDQERWYSRGNRE